MPPAAPLVVSTPLSPSLSEPKLAVESVTASIVEAPVTERSVSVIVSGSMGTRAYFCCR